MDFNDTTEKLGAHEVAAWLRRHPTFLQQFPDLALTLVVPRDNGPTASLASYQLDSPAREEPRAGTTVGRPGRHRPGQ